MFQTTTLVIHLINDYSYYKQQQKREIYLSIIIICLNTATYFEQDRARQRKDRQTAFV